MRSQNNSKEAASVSLQKFQRGSFIPQVMSPIENSQVQKVPLPELKVRGLQSASVQPVIKKPAGNGSFPLKFYVHELQCIVFDDRAKSRNNNNSEYVFVNTYLDAMRYMENEDKNNNKIWSNGMTINSESQVESGVAIKALPNIPAQQMRLRMKKYADNLKKDDTQQPASKVQARRIPKTSLSLLSAKSIHKVSAKRWCVYAKYKNDQQFNQILGFHDDKQCEVASITKVMTCYTTLNFLQQHNINPEQIRVKIPGHAECVDGTSAFLNAGGILTIKQLLYGLMLPSGNDAAIVLSMTLAILMNVQKTSRELWQKYINGGIIDCEHEIEKNKKILKQLFLLQMNQHGQQFRMEQTNYSSVHGMNDKKNQSTASNIVKLIQECIKMPTYLEVVGTRKFKTNAVTEKGTKSTTYKWKNTNKLLKKGWMGMKTGVTTNAGPCFSGYYKNLQFEAIIVVLNCSSMNQRWRDAEYLLEAVQQK